MTDLRNEVKRVKDIEDGIIKISKTIEELKSGRLTDDAIIDLIHAVSKVPKKTIKQVISGMENLAKTYLKPDKKIN